MGDSIIAKFQCCRCGKIFASNASRDRHTEAKKKCKLTTSWADITEVIVIGFSVEQLERLFGKSSIYQIKKSNLRIEGVNYDEPSTV